MFPFDDVIMMTMEMVFGVHPVWVGFNKSINTKQKEEILDGVMCRLIKF